MEAITIERVYYKANWRLFITAPKNNQINNILRSIKGRTFSGSQGKWHLPDTPDTLEQLKLQLKDIAHVNFATVETQIKIIKAI